MTYKGTYRTASGKGVAELLMALGEHALTDMGAELYEEGSGIIVQAQGLVPVATGALRSSGYTAEPERVGDLVRVELGFGGPAAKINPKTGQSTEGYGLRVHEDLDAFHKVGEAMFLQQPFMWAQQGMAERIAEGLRKRGFGRYQESMTGALGEVADGGA